MPTCVPVIKAGKRDRTPVFVDLRKLVAAKERMKWLKENTDRGRFPPKVEKAIIAAKGEASLAAALAAVVDERGSPRAQIWPHGPPLSQPTDEGRRTGSHYTPRELIEPIVRHALAPALERLGDAATPDEVLDLKVCDPAMGSGAFLVEACRQIADRLVLAWARHKARDPRSRRTRMINCWPAVWSRNAVCTAWTETRWRPTSPGWRSGSPLWRAITNSPFSITRCGREIASLG